MNNLTPFNKHARQQITVIELVNSLFYGLINNDLPTKSKMCLHGIIGRCDKIKDCLYKGQDPPIFAQRDFKKHQRLFVALRKFVLDSYGEKVTLDYFNAVMMLAFVVADTVKGAPEYIEHWQKVSEIMETVYGHMEGEGEHNHYISRGAHIKFKIQRIVEAT